jgi:hypothetical protein
MAMMGTATNRTIRFARTSATSRERRKPDNKASS